MDIAIIGAGNVGGALAGAARSAAHGVTVSAGSAASAEHVAALAGKVVVDATNPLNDTSSDLTTSGTSAAEQLQQQLPGTPVVKALNTVFASRYAAPVEAGQPLDAFLAGDDAQAKSTVSALVESLGFRPVDLGGLRMARTLEELAFANISLNATRGWSWQSAFRLVGPQGS